MSYTKYEPIGFENGTLVSPGKVDLETGEMTMPVYNGKAPVNATNLNHLEQGLVDLEEYATNLLEDNLDSDSAINAPSVRAVKELLNDYLFYKDGDTYTRTLDMVTGGYLTTAATRLYFTLTLPKRLDNIGSVTLDEFNVTARGISGYLLSNVDLADFDGTATVLISSENTITIALTQNTAFEGTNNTPVAFEINSLKLTFNETSTASEASIVSEE